MIFLVAEKDQSWLFLAKDWFDCVFIKVNQNSTLFACSKFDDSFFGGISCVSRKLLVEVANNNKAWARETKGCSNRLISAVEEFKQSSCGPVFACCNVGSIERSVDCTDIDDCFPDCALFRSKSFSTKFE